MKSYVLFIQMRLNKVWPSKTGEVYSRRSVIPHGVLGLSGHLIKLL